MNVALDKGRDNAGHWIAFEPEELWVQIVQVFDGHLMRAHQLKTNHASPLLKNSFSTRKVQLNWYKFGKKNQLGCMKSEAIMFDI